MQIFEEGGAKLLAFDRPRLPAAFDDQVGVSGAIGAMKQGVASFVDETIDESLSLPVLLSFLESLSLLRCFWEFDDFIAVLACGIAHGAYLHSIGLDTVQPVSRPFS